MIATLVMAELRRSFRLARAYWLEYVADFILYFAGFLLLVVVFQASSENYNAPGILGSIIGYITWKVCATCSINVADIADEESKTGTLEQIFLNGGSALQIFLARSLAYLFGAGIRGLIASLLFFLLVAPAPSVPALLLLFGISLVGAFGLGFLFAGLALVFKRVQAFTGLVFSLMIFFTGSLVGLERLGGWFVVLKLVFPLTWGISLMREAVRDVPLTVQWQSGEILGLILHSTVYLALGLGIFVWGYRRARDKGSLGHY